jgi:hypothetical protein
MIMSHITHNGEKLLPSAAAAIRTICEEDLHTRVVNKFTALQKELRRAGILDSQNRRIVQPAQNGGNAGAEAGGAGNAGAEAVGAGNAAGVAKKKKSILVSRAKGVSTALSTHCYDRF